MSGDFFGVLARRAVARPAVWPRLPSRFEEGGAGAGPGARHEDVEAPPVAVPASQAPTTMRSARSSRAVVDRRDKPDMADATDVPAASVPRARSEARHVTPAEIPTPAPRVRSLEAPSLETPKRRGRTPGSEPVDDGAGLGKGPRLVLPLTPAMPAVALAARLPAADLAGPPPAAAAPAALRGLTESRVIERLTLEPGRANGATPPPSAPAAVRQQSEPAAPPRVEIHIGRIEVMPATAPAAEPRRSDPTPQPQPPQSLDAYLAQRRRT